LGWVKTAGAVGSVAVVVPNIFCECCTQCRRLTINMRSVSSSVTVRTNCSAKQFARGQRGGIRTTWMPTSAKTVSNDAVNWPARSWTRTGTG
jgi:hypothetical protein